MTKALKLAVVGHTNVGKTSLLRTLTRDVEFGEVSHRPSTTRHVEGARLSVDGQPLLELYDTPGLESWLGFVERVQGGLQRILEAADSSHKIAVFTSGGTITALLHLITRMPAAQAFELNWQIVNTSLNQLKFRGREVALASFNSHTHLQLLKAPQLITFR